MTLGPRDVWERNTKTRQRGECRGILAGASRWYGLTQPEFIAAEGRFVPLYYVGVRERWDDELRFLRLPTVKIVILDGRPLSADRAAWSGLDRLGEVEFHEYTPPAEVPAPPTMPQSWSRTRPRSAPPDRKLGRPPFHHGHGDRL